MSLRVPNQIAEKTINFPESSYGACIVTLVLRDHRRIRNVTLAWANEIVRIGECDILNAADLDFEVSDIVDAFTEK